jgi:Co/Zn/Cd efflux system component
LDDCCSRKGDELSNVAHGTQRRVLVIVMVVNAVMFVAECSAGVVAHSSALIADSVDMLGDAIVYALSLYALARGPRWEAGAALAKGFIILAFGAAIVVEVGFKVSNGVTPASGIMLLFSSIALTANTLCLVLLWRFRKLNINMSSTFECSRNDIVSNIGVLIAGGLVAMLAAGWPDILVGGIIAIIFLRSAYQVIVRALPIFQGALGKVEFE